MRMRHGAVLVALAGLLSQATPASASHCGAGSYGCCPEPSCDAQCCFPACQQQCCTKYKLVWDNCLETRWHTTYQTVCEQVTKQFCEQQCKECCHTVCRPVQETCYKECCHQVPKQICETCYKEVCCTQYKCCVEQRYHLCKRCEYQEVCYTKTKRHKCGEWVAEEYCVPGKKMKCRQECRE